MLATPLFSWSYIT